MSHILPGTPLKVSLKFMQYGRVRLFGEYELIKSGMLSTSGLAQYPLPDVSFVAMDLIKAAINLAVTNKDKVTEKAKIKELKDAMRKNGTYVELHCGNDLAKLLISGYKEAQQGGGPAIAIGVATHFTVDDTGIVGEMKGRYIKPKGTKYVEGYSKKHSDPDTAYLMTQVTDLEEMVWEAAPKGVEMDYKIRCGAGRRKGGFTSAVPGICRY